MNKDQVRGLMLQSAQWAGAHMWKHAHEVDDGIGILIVHPSNLGAGQLMSIFQPHGAPVPERKELEEIEWAKYLDSLDEDVEAWQVARRAGTFVSQEDAADPMAVAVVPMRIETLLAVATGCIGDAAGETLRAQLELGHEDSYPEVTIVVDEMRLAWRNAEELLASRRADVGDGGGDAEE